MFITILSIIIVFLIVRYIWNHIDLFDDKEPYFLDE